jgi:hypothetical protein
MNSATTDPTWGIESQLPDLSTVPLTALRTLDDLVLHQALRHVVDQAEQVRVPSIRSGNGSNDAGERID